MRLLEHLDIDLLVQETLRHEAVELLFPAMLMGRVFIMEARELLAPIQQQHRPFGHTTGLAPPSTLIATPVMNEPASEQRKQAMRANSSALPMRPIGMRPLAMPSRNS